MRARSVSDNSGWSKDVQRMVHVVEISYWELGVGKSFLLCFFFCFFKILFIFRERGREGEREGEKHQCMVASRAPPTGDLA